MILIDGKGSKRRKGQSIRYRVAVYYDGVVEELFLTHTYFVLLFQLAFERSYQSPGWLHSSCLFQGSTGRYIHALRRFTNNSIRIDNDKAGSYRLNELSENIHILASLYHFPDYRVSTLMGTIITTMHKSASVPEVLLGEDSDDNNQ